MTFKFAAGVRPLPEGRGEGDGIGQKSAQSAIEMFCMADSFTLKIHQLRLTGVFSVAHTMAHTMHNDILNEMTTGCWRIKLQFDED